MVARESGKAGLLLRTAGGLFMKHGVGRVSVEEICSVAGVSKMTFYKYFPNKTAIATEVIEDLCSTWQTAIRAVIEGDLSFEEKIHQILALKIDMSRELSRDFMTELISGSGPELQEVVEQQRKDNMQTMRSFLAEGQRQGDVRSDLNIDFLMMALVKIRELYSERAVQDLYANDEAFIRDAFTFFYYGALAREEDPS